MKKNGISPSLKDQLRKIREELSLAEESRGEKVPHELPRVEEELPQEPEREEEPPAGDTVDLDAFLAQEIEETEAVLREREEREKRIRALIGPYGKGYADARRGMKTLQHAEDHVRKGTTALLEELLGPSPKIPHTARELLEYIEQNPRIAKQRINANTLENIKKAKKLIEKTGAELVKADATGEHENYAELSEQKRHLEVALEQLCEKIIEDLKKQVAIEEEERQKQLREKIQAIEEAGSDAASLLKEKYRLLEEQVREIEAYPELAAQAEEMWHAYRKEQRKKFEAPERVATYVRWLMPRILERIVRINKALGEGTIQELYRKTKELPPKEAAQLFEEVRGRLIEAIHNDIIKRNSDIMPWVSTAREAKNDEKVKGRGFMPEDYYRAAEQYLQLRIIREAMEEQPADQRKIPLEEYQLCIGMLALFRRLIGKVRIYTGKGKKSEPGPVQRAFSEASEIKRQRTQEKSEGRKDASLQEKELKEKGFITVHIPTGKTIMRIYARFELIEGKKLMVRVVEAIPQNNILTPQTQWTEENVPEYLKRNKAFNDWLTAKKAMRRALWEKEFQAPQKDNDDNDDNERK